MSFSQQLSAALARWRVGPPPRVEALVLDASSVPPPTSLEQARVRPTAAILGAALHGYAGNVEAARVGIQVARALPTKKRREDEQGLAQGRRLTLIELILVVLELRGVAVDASSEARIRSCEDLDVRVRWSTRAREIEAIAELFAAPRTGLQI